MRALFEKNSFLEKIRMGRAPVGFFNYLRDTAVLDVAGTVGFDFVVIDNEHTAMERETTEKLILAAELNRVVPFVRVPELIPYLMRNYMEMGARGILVPHIRSGDECRAAQEALRYPPHGSASCCRSNHADGFEAGNWMAYLEHVKDLVFVPMIEDPEAIENLDEILDQLMPGRDMVMFGKADYGQACGSLNADGTFTDEVNRAYLEVMRRCKARGVGFMACPSAGPNGQTAEDVKKVIDQGCSAVVLNTDQLTLAAAFRGIVGSCLDLPIQTDIRGGNSNGN